MMTRPRITAFSWVPEFARGYVRDLRPRWAFHETGQAHDVDLIDADFVKSDTHRRAQPFGQVPTYRDGEVEIFESGAIVLRIARNAPGLLPDDPAGRARAEQWVVAALNTIEPFVQDLAIVDLFEADQPWSKPRRPAVVARIEQRLADLSKALGERAWLDGDFSAGDLMMVAVLIGLRNSRLLERYPNLAAYVARGEARPAYKKALADHLAAFEAADEALARAA